MPPKRAHRPQVSWRERKLTRAQFGPLAANRVKPATAARYHRAVAYFLQFCLAVCMRPPRSPEELEGMVCTFIEGAWQEGEPLSLITDALSGIQ